MIAYATLVGNWIMTTESPTKTLQKAAEELFDNLGFSLSTSFRMFIKAALRERRLPLELKDVEPPLTGEVYKRMLDKSIAEANRGEVAYHELIEG